MRTKPDTLTDKMIHLLELSSQRVIRPFEGPRPFGVLRRRGLIRGGVITTLGRQVLDAALNRTASR